MAFVALSFVCLGGEKGGRGRAGAQMEGRGGEKQEEWGGGENNGTCFLIIRWEEELSRQAKSIPLSCRIRTRTITITEVYVVQLNA